MDHRPGVEFLLPRPDLVRLDDETLVWKLVGNRVWRCVDQRSRKTAELLLDLMCPGQRALFATSRCDAEVNNGGIHQFFYNTAGVLWRESCIGFRLIGGEQYARIVERAASLFPDGAPPDHYEARRVVLAALGVAPFQALTDGYFLLSRADETNITRLQALYVRSHPDEFYL